MYANVLKFHILIPQEKIGDPYFFLIPIISYFRVISLWWNNIEISYICTVVTVMGKQCWSQAVLESGSWGHSVLQTPTLVIINMFYRKSCIECKQCRPWSDAAFCSIWSGSALFANNPFGGFQTKILRYYSVCCNTGAASWWAIFKKYTERIPTHTAVANTVLSMHFAHTCTIQMSWSLFDLCESLFFSL